MSKPFRDASSGVGLDVVVTLPARVVELIEAQAKERGETVAGWRRAALIEAVAVEGQHATIERWLAAEAAMPLPPTRRCTAARSTTRRTFAGASSSCTRRGGSPICGWRRPTRPRRVARGVGCRG